MSKVVARKHQHTLTLPINGQWLHIQPYPTQITQIFIFKFHPKTFSHDWQYLKLFWIIIVHAGIRKKVVVYHKHKL
uniref:Uncharacterized protein n=1 Tax=Rhizophora mucronata TaxID=61149 RepID=A0A2P2PPM1_RHIMU